MQGAKSANSKLFKDFCNEAEMGKNSQIGGFYFVIVPNLVPCKQNLFMYKFLTGLLFFFFIIPYQLRAQILPKEGSELNYRIIGFLFSKGQPGSKYKIEIAAGNYNNEDSFTQNLIKSFDGDKNKIIGEVPAFGKQYTWRSVTSDRATITKSELHHFRTMINRVVDTNVTRLRIIRNTEKYKDAYVFMDGNKALYDMNGSPVWFLPDIAGTKPGSFEKTGDLKISKQGTITFLANRTGGQVYEINYNGAILWKGPDNGKVSGDSIAHYHHEFTRLSNGHYMVLGSEYVLWKLPSNVDSSFLKKQGNQKKIIWDSTNKAFYEKMHFGTIIEYDSKGKLVWSWKSSKYFKGSDIFSRTAPHGAFYISDVHENGFFFDKKSKTIYVSFKDISRILKVKYPEGNVTNIYGKKYDPVHSKIYGSDLFAQQHNCMISKAGYLCLFYNNDRHEKSLPTIIMMQEPHSKKDTLKKIWEYECTVDGIDTNNQKQFSFSNGGNVIELPDNSMFGCMSSPGYSKVFIVNRDKETLWSALPEAWNSNENKWNCIFQYRASIINRKELELLIWNQQ